MLWLKNIVRADWGILGKEKGRLGFARGWAEPPRRSGSEWGAREGAGGGARGGGAWGGRARADREAEPGAGGC